MNYVMNPCLVCTRVADPRECDNKKCTPWQNWFLSRWALIREYPRRQHQQPMPQLGVRIGGVCYAHPEQVKDYLRRDPCQDCACGEDVCKTPCRARQNWAKTYKEVHQ